MSGDDANPAGPSDFPRQVYSDARLAQALAIAGLEKEIAVLRLRLDELAGAEQIDYRLVALMANTLVRAVATQHRISPRARKDLAENIAAVLNSLGDQLLPPDR